MILVGVSFPIGNGNPPDVAPPGARAQCPVWFQKIDAKICFFFFDFFFFRPHQPFLAACIWLLGFPYNCGGGEVLSQRSRQGLERGLRGGRSKAVWDDVHRCHPPKSWWNHVPWDFFDLFDGLGGLYLENCIPIMETNGVQLYCCLSACQMGFCGKLHQISIAQLKLEISIGEWWN